MFGQKELFLKHPWELVVILTRNVQVSYDSEVKWRFSLMRLFAGGGWLFFGFFSYLFV
jgi:hypothetical protein